MFHWKYLKSIADVICIIIIGTLSGSQLDSMALGGGLKPEGGSSGRLLRLVVRRFTVLRSDVFS